MTRFAIRRAAQALPLLLVISVVVFGLIHLVPGGPLALYLDNPNVRPADIERLRRSLGLDRPLVEQYFRWLWAFVRGDWGYSYADGRAVAARLAERLPATLELVGASSLVAFVVALPVGVLAATRRGFDRISTAAAVGAISLPVFWFGLLLILLALGLVAVIAMIVAAAYNWTIERLAYKPLLAAGLPVAVYDLQHFMQWGTPEDVAEYRNCSQAFRQLLAPAGTPRDIIERIRADVAKGVADPVLQKRFLDIGIELMSSATNDEFAAFLRKQAAEFAVLVRETGMRAQ